MNISRLCKTALATAAVAGIGAAQAQVLGPTPYLGSDDSPFLGLTALYIETFEDGALNTPGVSASSGWTVAAPGALTDSVPADAAGGPTNGRSYYSGGTEASLTFTFDAAALGGLPTRAGIVWTDVGNVTTGAAGFGGVVFSAIDANGDPIVTVGPFMLGDGSAAGAAAEDRFFGLTHEAGIKSITIAMDNSVDWEVDHLQ